MAVEKQWVLHNWVCVFVALGILHAMRLRYIFVSGLPRSTLFFLFFSWKTLFSKKKELNENKMCVLIFFTTFVRNISDSKKKWVRFDEKCILTVMWSIRYSCSILMKLEFSQKIFRKILKYQISWKSIQWKPSSMRTDGQTDRTKLLVTFRNFANAPKNECT